MPPFFVFTHVPFCLLTPKFNSPRECKGPLQSVKLLVPCIHYGDSEVGKSDLRLAIAPLVSSVKQVPVEFFAAHKSVGIFTVKVMSSSAFAKVL